MEFKYFNEEEIEYLKEVEQNRIISETPRLNKFVDDKYSDIFIEIFCNEWRETLKIDDFLQDSLMETEFYGSYKGLIELSYRIIEYLFDLEYLNNYYFNIVEFKFKILDKKRKGIRTLEDAEIICKELAEIYNKKELYILYQKLIRDKLLLDYYLNQKYSIYGFIEKKIKQRRIEIEDQLDKEIKEKSVKEEREKNEKQTIEGLLLIKGSLESLVNRNNNKTNLKKETTETNIVNQEGINKKNNKEKSINIIDNQSNSKKNDEELYKKIQKELKKYIKRGTPENYSDIVNEKAFSNKKKYLIIDRTLKKDCILFAKVFNLTKDNLITILKQKDGNNCKEIKLTNQYFNNIEINLVTPIGYEKALIKVRNECLNKINPSVFPILERKHIEKL